MQRVKTFPKDKLDFEHLGEFVRSIDINSFDYKQHIPEHQGNSGYCRNILCLEPFELVLLRWKPEGESAIHYHQGFYGHVLVLEGECDNIEYRYGSGKLLESTGSRGIRGGIITEPEGVIHKLKNPNDSNELLTLHFYYPALDTLGGMVIYSEEGTRAVLSDKALSASFDEPESSFREVEENAFEFVPLHKAMGASHRIFPVIPKPKPSKISTMLNRYYAEQALYYDSFDLKHKSRSAYTKSINQMIADDINSDIEAALSLASGTGRRELEIREMSGEDYPITGVDISKDMCEIAEERGLKTIVGNLVEVQLPEEQYDMATFLYAFGHISGHEARLGALKKIGGSLKKGGALYFDVFNVNNKNEWGPDALTYYREHNLHEYGYESGDVFYKKVGGKEIAYLHYFTEEEIEELLSEADFEVSFIKYLGYVKNSGQELDDEEQGSLFVKAVKS